MKRKRKVRAPVPAASKADWDQLERDLQGVKKLNQMQRTLIANLEKAIQKLRK